MKQLGEKMVKVKRTEARTERCSFCRGYLDGTCNGSIAGACERYDKVEHPMWYTAERWVEYHA